MLYLVSTPIGNLADFSFRAVDVLKACDYILCEDKRRSRILLDHYHIQTPLRPFHKFNEAKTADRIVLDLHKDMPIALISDAGTPLIADPGCALVARCRMEKLSVTAIPGPCAAIHALTVSGLCAGPFQYIGFLPKKTRELQRVLACALVYPGVTIAYETALRIRDTLSVLATLSPSRQLCIARELTKLHEECLTGTASELLFHGETHRLRGEMVLLVAPSDSAPVYDNLSLQELVALLQKDFHLSKQDAIKMAAQMHKIPKREVYRQFMKL